MSSGDRASPEYGARLDAALQFAFPTPVYVGDTVNCTATVVEHGAGDAVAMEARGVNQAGAEVLRARFSGVPTDVRLAR